MEILCRYDRGGVYDDGACHRKHISGNKVVKGRVGSGLDVVAVILSSCVDGEMHQADTPEMVTETPRKHCLINFTETHCGSISHNASRVADKHINSIAWGI